MKILKCFVLGSQLLVGLITYYVTGDLFSIVVAVVLASLVSLVVVKFEAAAITFSLAVFIILFAVAFPIVFAGTSTSGIESPIAAVSTTVLVTLLAASFVTMLVVFVTWGICLVAGFVLVTVYGFWELMFVAEKDRLFKLSEIYDL